VARFRPALGIHHGAGRLTLALASAAAPAFRGRPSGVGGPGRCFFLYFPLFRTMIFLKLRTTQMPQIKPHPGSRSCRRMPRGKAGFRGLRQPEPGSGSSRSPPSHYLTLYREIQDCLDPNEILDRLIEYSDTPVILNRRLIAITAPPTSGRAVARLRESTMSR
jgi:hypothetical protein